MKPRVAATRTNAATAAAAPPPSEAATEHIFIGSEELAAEPAKAARTVRETFTLDDVVRREGAKLTLYAEGVLEVRPRHKGESGDPRHFDLRFLDPVPKVERVTAVRCLYAALGCGATAALAAFLLRFDALFVAATAVLAATLLASAVAVYLAIYRTREITEFCTLHGRSTVLRLVASLGSMKRFRACVPALSQAIEEAGERIGTDTAAHLRAEMREHYRLRNDGVLDSDECAASTGRILAQFDVQL